MDLSLIIATFNRCDSLRRTLSCIEQQHVDADWELIIVDNRSTDETAEFVERFSVESKLNVVLVHEPKPGLGNARNAGLRAAKGELVLFTDDDCLPAKDYLEKTLQVFHEDPNVGFVGGRILLHDKSDQPITIKESSIREDIPAGQFIEAGVIHGANLAFRKTALMQAGGFDPFFGAGSFYSVEDIDSAAHVSALGWKGVYDPRPLVFHHHGRKSLDDVASLKQSYARGRGAYYVKCILQNRWTITAWKQWYWSLRRKPIGDIFCELIGGASFFARNLWDRGRRFQGVRLSKAE